MENWNYLSDEEKQRLLKREPIAKDDATAICTAAGWEAWQRFSHDERKLARGREARTEAAKAALRRR